MRVYQGRMTSNACICQYLSASINNFRELRSFDPVKLDPILFKSLLAQRIERWSVQERKLRIHKKKWLSKKKVKNYLDQNIHRYKKFIATFCHFLIISRWKHRLYLKRKNTWNFYGVQKPPKSFFRQHFKFKKNIILTFWIRVVDVDRWRWIVILNVCYRIDGLD